MKVHFDLGLWTGEVPHLPKRELRKYFWLSWAGRIWALPKSSGVSHRQVVSLGTTTRRWQRPSPVWSARAFWQCTLLGMVHMNRFPFQDVACCNRAEGINYFLWLMPQVRHLPEPSVGAGRVATEHQCMTHGIKTRPGCGVPFLPIVPFALLRASQRRLIQCGWFWPRLREEWGVY